MAWNPVLRADCSNVVVGQVYCVDGLEAASMMNRAAVAPTGIGEVVKREGVGRQVVGHQHMASHGGSMV